MSEDEPCPFAPSQGGHCYGNCAECGYMESIYQPSIDYTEVRK